MKLYCYEHNDGDGKTLFYQDVDNAIRDFYMDEEDAEINTAEDNEEEYPESIEILDGKTKEEIKKELLETGYFDGIFYHLFQIETED